MTTATAMAVALTIPGAVAFAPAASATVSAGYIDGSGDVTNDWDNEGPFSTSSNRRSLATAVWQLALWAEGYYSGEIDCEFGPATRAATIKFQAYYKLKQDGIAGKETLSKASENLVTQAGDYVKYNGRIHDVEDLRRLSDGRYLLSRSDGYRVASYTSTATC